MKKALSILLLVLILVTSCSVLAEQTAYVAVSSGVYMRAAASLDSVIIAKLACDTPVSITSSVTDGFVRCRAELADGSAEGYIWYECLSDCSSNELSELPEGDKLYVRTWEGLNVRTAADLESDIIIGIGLNHEVIVTGTSGFFTQCSIEVNGSIYSSFVWSDCLSDTLTSETAALQVYIANHTPVDPD